MQRTALEDLAYKMQLEGQGGASGTAIPLAQARAYLPQRVTVSGRQWDVTPDVLLRLAAAASLVQIGLDERGNWRDARFWHQLLQEYFAAGELERRFAVGEDLAALWRWPYWLESKMPRWERPRGNDDPLPPPPGSGWEETAVLLAGLSGNPSRLVEAIVQANPVLAGRCLAESGAVVDEAVRSQVQEALLKTMRDVEVALRVRIAAGNVLGDLGDPRFGGPYLLPEFITIPAGPFMMGSNEYEGELPIHPVDLGEYAMARYPVTNAQYAVFVEATGREPPRHFQGNHPPPGKGNHPIVNVTWRDAVTYCEWLSGETGLAVRLPSEAEWEKAAGWDEKRQKKLEYPWGDGWDERRCNTEELSIWDTTPVGIFPHGASPYGCLDMAGNVWEWTISLWGDYWLFGSEFKYPYDPADGRENLEAGDHALRVLRGGSFSRNRYAAGCAVRLWFAPYDRHRFDGFRVCVVSQ